MNPTMSHAFKKNFLGNSPGWYEKRHYCLFSAQPAYHSMCLAPLLWAGYLIAEFIFTLAMALKVLSTAARGPTGH